MVKKMIWLGLLWSVFAGQAWAAISVLQPKEIILGQAIIWSLKGEQAGSDFQKLDLTVLEKQFKVADIDLHRDRVRVVLYPLQTGDLRFPHFRQGGIQVPEQRISVKENPDVKLEWHPPKTEVWQKQWAAWRVTVKVKDAGFQVIQVLPKNSSLNWLGQTQALQRTADNKVSDFVLLARSLKPGQVVMPAPVIEIKNRSPRKWRFYAPDQSLEIKALPGFIPEEMPIGKVRLQAEPLPFWAITGRLQSRQWRLAGEAVIAEELPVLTEVFAPGAPNLEWLLPESKAAQSWQKAGFSSEMAWSKPYRILSSGQVVWPDVHWTFFNPETGKLETHSISGGTQWSLLFWLWLVVFGLLSLLGGMFLFALWLLGQAWLWKRRLLKALSQQNDPEMVWQLLQGVVKKQGMNDSFSLADWRQQIQDWKLDPKGFMQALEEKLNYHFYRQAEEAEAIQSLANQWAESLPINGLMNLRLRQMRQRFLNRTVLFPSHPS